MKIIQVFINNSLRNFNYILYSETSKDAIFFDPTDLSQTLPHTKKLGLRPKFLLNTHKHFDHIADNKKFLEIEGTEHLQMHDNEVLYIDEYSYLKCVDTPGHTADHQCYFLYEREQCIGVITGDTVFNAGVGNCKNGGNVSDLYKTIKDKFIPLEDKVKIYPSHDYFINNLKFAKTIEPSNLKISEYEDKISNYSEKNEFYITSIGEEKLFNPFFRLFLQDNMQEKTFTDLRQKRDKW